MWKIQIIYSTLEKGQHCANVPLPVSALSNSQSLLDFALAVFHGKYCFMPDNWRDDINKKATSSGVYIPTDIPEIPILTKISTWVTWGDEKNDIGLPDWYYANEGKYYWDTLNPGKERPF